VNIKIKNMLPVLLGWMILGEALTPKQILATIIVIPGVLLSNTQ